MTDNMLLPGDRVVYRGSRGDLWNQVAVVRGVTRDGAIKLSFKTEPKLLLVCPSELLAID
jgi:hypothetical protein